MSLPLPADADYYRSLSSLHLEVERQRLIAIVDRIGVQMEVIERLGQNPEWLRLGRARRVGAYAHLELIKQASKQVRRDEQLAANIAAKQARVAAGLAKHQADIAKHQERKAAQKAARAEAASQRREAEAARRKAQIKENKKLAEKYNVAERARQLAEQRIQEYRNGKTA